MSLVGRASFFARLRANLQERLTLSSTARHGRDRGMLIGGCVMFLALLAASLLPFPSIEGTLGIAVMSAITVLAIVVTWLAFLTLRTATPRFWLLLLFVLLPAGVPLVMSGFRWPAVLALTSVIAFATAMLGGGWAALRADSNAWPARAAVLVGVLLLGGSMAFLATPGWRALPARPPLPPQTAATARLLPALTERGPNAVLAFTYGSGSDRHRPEYATGARLRSRSVDGRSLIDGWDGAAGWARTRFWGFDASRLPLQGRVWMPTGGGPLPLVLVVHGNHLMQDFSDAGYAYLGEHLASHGFIAVSIDQNFLNSGDGNYVAGPDGGLDTENDARGWLLLEHLRQLRDWHRSKATPFSGRIDLDRIALIGHSRGGEAVAEAALFNRLSAYPDNASVRFDYQFGIRAIIAIAPADGQYDPRNRPTALTGVSYLTLQGSHDGDVQSFIGTAQYARVSLAGCSTCFKSSVYLVGANHGQFNTGWGRYDFGPPGQLLLDVAGLLDPRQQRTAGKAIATAFLRATLLNNASDEAWFRAAPQQLAVGAPPIELMIDYASGAEQVLADFEEDADVATASWAAALISAQALTVWREQVPSLKWGQRDSAVVALGWHQRSGSAPAEYRIDFVTAPPTPASIGLSLAIADEDPRRDADTPWKTPTTLDASLFVVDRQGRRASVPLARFGGVRAAVTAETRKWAALDDTPTSEPVLRRIDVPASALAGVDLGALARVGLRFDRSPAGVLLVDDWRLRPAATAGPTNAR